MDNHIEQATQYAKLSALYKTIIYLQEEVRKEEDKLKELQKKEDMKKRGLASPDMADALAMTFAYPVAPKGMGKYRGQMAKMRREYNPLAKRAAWK